MGFKTLDWRHKDTQHLGLKTQRQRKYDRSHLGIKVWLPWKSKDNYKAFVELNGIIEELPKFNIWQMFPFIIFNLAQNMDKPFPHRKHVELRSTMQIQRIFIVDLVFKFNFQLCHQIKFCFACKCNINVFQIANPWIIWPFFMDKY